MDITYRARVAGGGWQAWIQSGEVAGAAGESRQMEAIQIKLVDSPEIVSVQDRLHVTAGTIGQSRRMEGARIVIARRP